MNSSRIQHAADLALAEDCLAGKPAAWENLRAQLHEPLMAALIARGATPIEAADVLADLWGDTVLKSGDRGLLERYDGSHSLRAWLGCIATHRLVDLKRRQRFSGEIPAVADGEPNDFDALPCRAELAADGALLGLMRDALQEALRELAPETRLFLRLVYLEGITQRELASIWRCDESKISRQMRAGMSHIAERTLTLVRLRDPYLAITWDDFVALCGHSADTLFI
jgi:RNA polymerase sigma factor (sigma-70 family)